MKIFKYTIAMILLSITTSLMAQQTGKVTRTFFPNPDVEITTPAFQPKGKWYTSYKMMSQYLEKVAQQNPDIIQVENVGKTQKKRDILLVTVSNGQPSDNKLRIFYTGCMHGNEHAGTEGLMFFIHQLANNPSMRQLLQKADFYIIPMLNADGSEADTRATANGNDPNRDHTLLTTPEVACLHEVATRINPHVFIDFHEYKPLRTSFDDISDRIIMNKNDFMFLYSSNPNVAPSITQFITNRLVPAAQQMAQRWGLVNDLYFTTKTSRGDTFINMGGSSPRSSSNIMALRGYISMLMEIRGVGLNGTSYKRRVNTVYQLAYTYASTAVNHAEEVIRAVADAATNKADIVTRFNSAPTQSTPMEFIDLIKAKYITIPVDVRKASECQMEQTRVRPKAYYIDASEKQAIELVKKFGIQYETLHSIQSLSLQAYNVTYSHESNQEILGRLPLTVKTDLETLCITLQPGSIRIPMNQPLSTLCAILLEPECENGFVNFRVVNASQGMTLPIYREE